MGRGLEGVQGDAGRVEADGEGDGPSHSHRLDFESALAMTPKPGDTIRYTLEFTGVVARIRASRDGTETYITVRNNRGEQTILASQVTEILDPEPPEADVIAGVRCPVCRQPSGKPCLHRVLPDKELKHPHHERIAEYIHATNWPTHPHSLDSDTR
jgi:hypothetical protein